MFSSLFGRQGDTGAQGIQGIQGIQGVKGDTGDTGSSGLTDFGDTDGYTFTLSDFTTDGNWYELDLSAKVPEGTYAVDLEVEIRDNAAGNGINFRKNGNSNGYNVFRVGTHVANVQNDGRGKVFLDENRKLSYATSVVTFDYINVTICNYYTV